jgi:hypothetical protein
MRVADRPLPTSIVLSPDDIINDWPVRPVVALERVPVPPYVWDDGTVWDAAGKVWDAATVNPVWTDATCDVVGLDVTYGPPDEHGNIPAGQLGITLDNTSGRWTRYNVDGSPGDYGAGLQLWVWAQTRVGTVTSWWVFAGRISRYDERVDGTVDIEAFDALADLAQPIGTFTPGAGGDLPNVRLAAIMTSAVAPLIRTRFAAGVVHLTAQATDQAPLEEMQTVTASDGGMIYGDADGTVVSVDRTWRVGRTDQTVVPVIGTNVCSAPVVLWDPVISTSDDHLAGTVILENVALLKATASNPQSPSRTVFAEKDQQWTTQAEGDTLAAWLVAQQWQPRLALDSADVYLDDPQHNYWPALDWRRGDRMRLLHDTRTPNGAALRLVVDVILIGIADSITPEHWIRSIITTRAIAYIAAPSWDQTVSTWNDPAAVWGY